MAERNEDGRTALNNTYMEAMKESTKLVFTRMTMLKKEVEVT